MNLKIILNKNVRPVKTIESYDDNDGLIGILDKVCYQIDKKKIASFSVNVDNIPISKKIDFAYDFTSIATELTDLEVFLINKKDGIFKLNFYELSIVFSIKFELNKKNLVIYRENKQETIVNYSYNLDAQTLFMEIHKCLNIFESILNNYFPIAYTMFKSEGYVFSSVR